MARLNIEERFFADSIRYQMLAKMMGWPDEDLGIGKLAKLWHFSQSAERVEADGEEICVWANVFEDQDRFLNVMCHKFVRFLVLQPNGLYRICGNKEQIDNLSTFKKRAKKAAKKRWAAHNAEKAAKMLPNPSECLSIKNNPKHSDECLGIANACSSNASSIENDAPSTKNDAQALPKQCQYNTRQDNTVFNNIISGDQCSESERERSADATLIVRPEGRTDAKKENNESDLPTLSLDTTNAENSDEPNTKQKSKPKPKIKTWESDNPFSGIFTQLLRSEAYKRVFDVPRDIEHLTECMRRFDLTYKEVEQEAWAMVNWDNNRPATMKNPRSTFTNWLKNAASGRRTNGGDLSKFKTPQRKRIIATEEREYDGTDAPF